MILHQWIVVPLRLELDLAQFAYFRKTDGLRGEALFCDGASSALLDHCAIFKFG